MGYSKGSCKSNTIPTQETRKILNRQPNFTSKTTGKIRTKSPKISIRKEIINIRTKINEKEMKETIININKPKAVFLRI